MVTGKTGCGGQDTGCRMQDAEDRMQDKCYWIKIKGGFTFHFQYPVVSLVHVTAPTSQPCKPFRG